METRAYYTTLLAKYIQGELTEPERGIFLQSLQDESQGTMWNVLLEEAYAVPDTPVRYEANEWEEAIQGILASSFVEVPVVPIAPIAPVRRVSWKRWVAAAAVVAILFSATYLFLQQRSVDSPIVDAGFSGKDVAAPNTVRATITLSNGQTVVLDSAHTGTLATEQNVQLVRNASGQLMYEGQTAEVLYNTLQNPRGSKVIDLVLSDGSHVWLNAGSSITYPVSFSGDQRSVDMKGEAYFEVAPDAAHPFVVHKETMAVTVLGTHFNVKAYTEDAAIHVTLLEGSVKVDQATASVKLKPGQQAVVTEGVRVNTSVDTEQVMAWKNGLFSFNQTSLVEMLQEVSRWYDVEIVVEGTPPARTVYGKMQRDLNLAQVLKILDKMDVHYQIDGKKLILLP